MTKFKFESGKIVEVKIDDSLVLKLGDFLYSGEVYPREIAMVARFGVCAVGKSIQVRMAYRNRKRGEIWFSQSWISDLTLEDFIRAKGIIDQLSEKRKKSIRKCFLEAWLTWPKRQ